jgi:flagellar biosynthetic protein FliO
MKSTLFLAILLLSLGPSRMGMAKNPEGPTQNPREKRLEEKLAEVEKGASEASLNQSPEEIKRSHEESEAEVKSLTQIFIRMLLALLFVVLIAFFVLRALLPKWSGFQPRGNPYIKIVSRFPLEPRKSLFILEIKDTFHLIGVSDHNINYLTALAAPEIKAIWGEEAKKVGAFSRSFADVLRGVIKKDPGESA